MIKIANLNFKIKNKVVFKDLSLSLDKGSFNVLIGKNGTGKTTLLKMLSSVLFPNSGTITIDSNELNDIKVKKDIVFAPSNINVYNRLSVNDILLYVARFFHNSEEAKKEILKVAKEFKATHILKKQFSKLSLGEVKKAILIQTFLRDCKYYFLDEPLANLEPETKELFLNKLRNLVKKGKIILLATHSLKEIDFEISSVILLNKNKATKYTKKIEINSLLLRGKHA